MRERWTREQAWAPAYIDAEMRTAYELGREYREDAALAGARLATLEPDDPEWEPTAAQLARSEHLAELHLERARQLDEIHHARGGWHVTTEEARIADQAARDELARRGLAPQRELERAEQLELFDPAEVTEPAPDVEVDTAAAELDAAVEVLDEPQLDAAADRGADSDVGAAARDAEREPEPAAERVVDEPLAELDDVELEEQLAAADQAQRVVDRDDDIERAPAAEVERPEPELEPVGDVVEREPEPAVEVDDIEQLALLDIEPSITDQVGAEPLRAPEPAAEPTIGDSTAVELERAQTTLAEARRQAEAVERQRVAREAAAAERAAEADRTRRDEAELERHDQSGREQRAEQGRGVVDDDALGIDY